MSGTLLNVALLAVLFATLVLAYAARGGPLARRADVRAHRRRCLAVLAALRAAAIDDERADVDRIVEFAREQVAAADAALLRGDATGIERMLGAVAVSLDRFAPSARARRHDVRLKRSGPWTLTPVAVRNEGPEQLRVVVRATATVEVWCGRLGFWPTWVLDVSLRWVRVNLRAARRHCSAWLVLHATATGWELEQIMHGRAGLQFLTTPLLSDPASDDGQWRALAVRELANDELGDDVPLLPDRRVRDDARAALLDLALADPRWAQGAPGPPGLHQGLEAPPRSAWRGSSTDSGGIARAATFSGLSIRNRGRVHEGGGVGCQVRLAVRAGSEDTRDDGGPAGSNHPVDRERQSVLT